MSNVRRYLVPSLAFLCLAVAAFTLANTAWHLARREAAFRTREAAARLHRQVAEAAVACRGALEQDRQELIRQLRESAVDDIDALPVQIPLLRSVFVTDGTGQPLHPAPDEPFWRRFRGLFLEGSEDDPAAMSERPDATAQAEPAPPPFVDEIRHGVAGWIPWCTDNRFRLVVWVRDDGGEDVVYGGEVDTEALLAALAVCLPAPIMSGTRLDLADARGRVFGAVGADLDAIAPDQAAAVREPDAWAEVAPATVPLLRVRGYLGPDHREGRAGDAFARQMQILALLIVLLAAGLALPWLTGRETVVLARKPSRPEAIRLQDDLAALAETMRPALVARGMTLTLEMPSVPLEITSDREALAEVVQSLLGNAATHAGGGGEVTLAVSAAPGGGMVLRVLDRGPGVPNSKREKIFRRKRHPGPRRDEAIPGPGFDLATARALMRENHGDLTCHARPGGGAEFRLVLP